MVWTISGLVIMFLSLIVNVLQYLQNKKLKNDINHINMKAGANSKQNAQTHSGTGDNINVGHDAFLGK